jgi:murein L,D-transpeptidase YcbB/YkuD
MRLARALAPAVVLLTMFGCGRGDLTGVTAAVGSIVGAKRLGTASVAVWADVHAFYASRAHEPAWVTAYQVSKLGAQALRVAQSTHLHGLDPRAADDVRAAHDAVATLAEDAPNRAATLAAFDVRLTAALLRAAREVALGRIQPRAVEARWRARRTAPDFVATLAAAIDDGDLSAWLASLAPPHPEYAALQTTLAALYAQQEKGGWPRVPAARFAAGRSHRAVAHLRQRLAASGELHPSRADGSTVYDAAVADAVRQFQERHRLPASGIAGAATIAALNVPVEQRIRQIEINLDRWRWLPDDLGTRHLLVNIPSFTLYIREGGSLVNDIRVVVGEPGNATPVFSSEMQTVVFSPYWNIPDTIAVDETAPAIAQDENYLRRNRIDILRVSGSRAEPVDPGDVDWENPAELERLRFRQRPGPGNALGHVKFLFPNPYSVYLHDTPADNLFRRHGRAFSHGCVRVEEPHVLAAYLLRDQPQWTPARIAAAMHAGSEKAVALAAPLPVHLAYFTAWVEADGSTRFLADIYGHDRRHAAAVARP